MATGTAGSSPHAVLAHEGDDAGGGPRFAQEGVLQEFVGGGPLHRVPHQHAVEEAFEGG